MIFFDVRGGALGSHPSGVAPGVTPNAVLDFLAGKMRIGAATALRQRGVDEGVRQQNAPVGVCQC